jgi:hypothetical protein
MESSVLSFLKAEWKVSDTGSAHWASSILDLFISSIIGPGSHIEYPTGTKNSNFVEDHPRNIPAKFGSNRPSDFGEEAWNVKSLQTTDEWKVSDTGSAHWASSILDLFISSPGPGELLPSLGVRRLLSVNFSHFKTFHRCFLPSFCSFGQAVSEEKIFLEIDQSETRIACGDHVC